MILYACSSNAGKLKEFELASRRRGSTDVRIEPLPGLESIAAPDETGKSFEENASLKAVHYSGFSKNLVFADDSGLEVHSLGGAPGVHSARYSGANATDRANSELLLRNLKDEKDRSARFVCVIALAEQRQIRHICRASVEGVILPAPRGQGGFGYDPLFFYPPFKRTFAELTPEEKLAVSHRGKALEALFSWLREHKASVLG